MAKFNKRQVFQTMEDTGMVPVFYHSDVETAKKVLKACYDGGVRAFEFTNRGEKAVEVFAELIKLAENLPGMILGIGSISFGRDARKFIKLGANFVVSPQYVPAAVSICRWRRIPYIPGCGTISEIGHAQRSGCEICKLFPGDVLGPAFVKGLKAPMPWSRIMVTGGVKPTEENLSAWFKAGVTCVGMGSNLFPKESIAAEKWEDISVLCKNALEIIKSVR